MEKSMREKNMFFFTWWRGCAAERRGVWRVKTWARYHGSNPRGSGHHETCRRKKIRMKKTLIQKILPALGLVAGEHSEELLHGAASVLVGAGVRQEVNQPFV